MTSRRRTVTPTGTTRAPRPIRIDRDYARDHRDCGPACVHDDPTCAYAVHDACGVGWTGCLWGHRTCPYAA